MIIEIENFYLGICFYIEKGEEIGMTDVIISWEESVDPPACNSNETTYYSVSRDPAR